MVKAVPNLLKTTPDDQEPVAPVLTDGGGGFFKFMVLGFVSRGNLISPCFCYLNILLCLYNVKFYFQ